MKTKDIQTLKIKPVPELQKMLADDRKKLRDLQFDLTAGKVKNVAQIRELKKNIARIITFIKQSPETKTK